MAQSNTLRLAGTDRDLRPVQQHDDRPVGADVRNGYRFRDADRSDVRGLFQLPTFAADGSIDMRQFTETGGHLRLADPVDPAAVIRVGDSLFGSTVTDLCFLDRRPNRDRFTFSYELADGRYGMAVATLCA
jgi:hypothetical protein